MKRRLTSPRRVQQKVLSWYQKHQRVLPWRATKDPYKILVSEIMLQQTQVDRVIPYYKKFLKAFPSRSALAKADKRTVLAHWSGLGYNSRGLRLQQIAQHLQNKPFPKTEEELLKLPGIGPYTARAILAFAFNKEVPVIDTNIRRVLIHELKLAESIEQEALEAIARKCIPKGKSCIWHNALMDYGAVEKTARATGIKPLSKQSKFQGSTRQVRGSIVKYLLQKKIADLATLQQLFPHDEFMIIVEKMKKENIIKQEGKHVVLA